MAQLKTGDRAPDFQTEDHLGRGVRLGDHAGQKLFVFFFPKAGTSG